jgi:hypothetical protein
MLSSKPRGDLNVDGRIILKLIKGIGYGGLDSAGSGYSLIARSHEHSSETPDSIKVLTFLDHPNDCQFAKNESVPWS